MSEVIWHLMDEGLAYITPGITSCCDRKIEALPDDDMIVHSWDDVPTDGVQCRLYHVLSEPTQVHGPGGKDGFYYVACTCGYRTGFNGYAHRAQKAAEAHKAAKEANSDANRDGEDRA
jgi:hypothetical protein